MKRKTYKIIIFLIFFSAVFLRIFLGSVNIDANDDHLEVIKIIYKQNIIPTESDCFECYHPKLYHYLTAEFWKILKIEDPRIQIWAAIMINCLAGIFTLVIIFLFINGFKIDDKFKIIAFSLAAFNPELIKSSVQPSNNSFVILFGTGALFFLYLFLIQKKSVFFYLILFFSIYAGLAKGNGLIIIFGIFLVLIAKPLLEWQQKVIRKENFKYLILYVVIALLVVSLSGQYWDKYLKYHNPFFIPLAKAPAPHLIKETFTWESALNRPGVTSIINSYFTFRLIDLIKNPMNENWAQPQPYHRTSFWTQLYAWPHFIHFAAWPPSWRDNSQIIINLGRVIFIFALLPALLFLIGFIINFKNIFLNLIKKRIEAFKNFDWIYIFFTILFLAFIISFSYLYRDFSAMQTVYIYPCLLYFIKVFIDGMVFVYSKLKNKKLILLMDLCFFILISAYCLDIVLLGIKLLNNYTLFN